MPRRNAIISRKRGSRRTHSLTEMVIIVDDDSATKDSSTTTTTTRLNEVSQHALGPRGCTTSSPGSQIERQQDDSSTTNSSSDQNDNSTSSSFAPPGATIKHEESPTNTHPHQQEGNLLPLNDLALLLATQLTAAQKKGLFRSEPYLRMSSSKIIDDMSTPEVPASKTTRTRRRKSFASAA